MVAFEIMRTLCSICCIFLLLLAAGSSAFGRSSRISSSSGGPKWNIHTNNGVRYISVAELWRFYGFKSYKSKGRAGFVTYGSKNRYVSVRAGQHDFYVNTYRYILSFPILSHGRKLYISVTDVKKLVDPVLRPRLSKNVSLVKTVVIDAGHGGHDSGAVRAGVREKTCNLALAKKLEERLKKRGFKVVMTRSGDFFLTLQQRVNIANKQRQAIFISIHHNSARTAGHGIETFTLAPQGTTSPFARSRVNSRLEGNNHDAQNIALATALHSRAIKTTKAVDRGIQRARFSVLCTIECPAILYEGGFISHPKERLLISSDSYQNRVADALCEGVVSYAAVAASARRRR